MTFPNINPVAFSLGDIQVRWYGVTYLLTFLIAYLLIGFFAKERKLKLNGDLISDIVFAGLVGVVLGGRIGYMLFYNLPYYLSNPVDAIKIWNGGMSFHGGMLGVILALFIFAKVKKLPFYSITDTIVPIVPLGIILVRIGNFINAELYGRITTSPICINFPTDPANCRYPSQLIQAGLEGFVTFLVVFFLRKKIKTPGLLSWVFILAYGALRFVGEFFREPDLQIGFLPGGLTEGQYFSILMITAALIGIYFTKKKIRSGARSS